MPLRSVPPKPRLSFFISKHQLLTHPLQNAHNRRIHHASRRAHFGPEWREKHAIESSLLAVHCILAVTIPSGLPSLAAKKPRNKRNLRFHTSEYAEGTQQPEAPSSSRGQGIDRSRCYFSFPCTPSGGNLRQRKRPAFELPSIGSGGGVSQIKKKTVDFGASDEP